MSYVAAFKDAVTPQASPKAKVYTLSDYLVPGCPDHVIDFVAKAPPLKLTNPHIWEAATERLDDALLNYAIVLIAKLAHYHDQGLQIEHVYDECEAFARPHFSISEGDYAQVRRLVVTPCYQFSRFIPEKQRVFAIF